MDRRTFLVTGGSVISATLLAGCSDTQGRDTITPQTPPPQFEEPRVTDYSFTEIDDAPREIQIVSTEEDRVTVTGTVEARNGCSKLSLENNPEFISGDGDWTIEAKINTVSGAFEDNTGCTQAITPISFELTISYTSYIDIAPEVIKIEYGGVNPGVKRLSVS